MKDSLYTSAFFIISLRNFRFSDFLWGGLLKSRVGFECSLAHLSAQYRQNPEPEEGGGELVPKKKMEGDVYSWGPLIFLSKGCYFEFKIQPIIPKSHYSESNIKVIIPNGHYS